MSIWDYFSGNASPEQQAGLLGLSTALNGSLGDGRRPVGFGQALAAGAQGMQQGRDQYNDREQAKQALAMQAKLMGFKLKEAESDFDNQEAQRARAKKLIEFNQKYFGGGIGAGGQAPAGMDGMSQAAAPQMQAPMMGGPASLPQLGAQPGAAPVGGMQQKSGVFDQRMAYAQALRADGFAEQADAQEAQALKFQPKVSGWKEVKQNGKVLYAPFFEDGTNGNPVPLEVAKQLEKVNTGGTTELVDSFTGATVRSLNNTMKPGETASNGIARANLGLSQQRLALERQNAGKPVYNAEAGGFILPPSPANPGGKIIPLSGAGGGKMTEDQAKATGWLVQAENAYKNLRNVAFDKNGKIADAAKPGFGDAVAAVPGLGALGNTLRSADRQKFNQATSSMAEAFLRAATGAGVNREEAAQKVQEITPVWGEDEEVTRQKFESIPLYIDSLKVRAGPGAKKAAGVLAGPAPAGGGWSIKKVGQ